MGKFRNKLPHSSNWTPFDQELMELSNSVKNKLEKKIEDLRRTQKDLEDELASVEYDIDDLKRAKKLVDCKYPRRPSGRTKLFLDNLHYKINERDLEYYFSCYGRICFVYIVRSRLTKMSRGYGYVEFIHECDAERVMDDADDEPHKIHGRYITTRFASEHSAENRALHRHRTQTYRTQEIILKIIL